MMVPKGTSVPVPQGCERGQTARDLMGELSGEIFRPSDVTLVWGLVCVRSHGHPHQESGSREEDNFHSDLR